MGIQKLNRIRGFTLVELMVSVAVAGILLALAVPGFSEYFAKSRLRGAADDLTNQLALARANAMRMDRDVVVSVVGTGTTWCSGGRQFEPVGTVGLVQASGFATCNCSTDASQCLVTGDQSLVTSTTYTGVEVVSVTGTAALQFDRKVGILTDLATRTVRFRSTEYPSNYVLNVVVSPMGHARVCVPSGARLFGGYRSC